MSIFFDVNWLAVIIAVLASALVGYLWYGPLFGKRWIAAMGGTAAPTAATVSETTTDAAVEAVSAAATAPETTPDAAAEAAPAKAEEKTKTGSPNNAMTIMLALTLVQCFLVSSLIDYYKGSLGSVILWAVVTWFAIVVPLLANQWLFEKRRLDLVLISAGQQLVSLLAASFVIGVWY
ncbi:MAG: DUF1761 domain-containing protein [Spirochaetota bacterium]|nr:DUF1761 domain-containing protein [Spirochaetota bacterium]